MRLHLFLAATALLPSIALAEEAVPAKKSSSIVMMRCEDCPPLKQKGKLAEYQAPDIADNIQATIVRDVDGQKTIERAEQWLGGAHVRYVSRSQTFMPPEAELMATPATNIDKPDDGVDAGVTTSAVEAPKVIDAEAMPLRN
jgi:hypothetical protein